MKKFLLGEDELSYQQLFEMARTRNPPLQLSERSRSVINKYRHYVEEALRSGETYYGINTGFGFLSNVKIDSDNLRELQINLIRSHACGVGQLLPAEVSRGLLILRAHTFALGYSGISAATVDTILAFLERDVLPVIPSQGSVGASGDLPQLAHLALGLMAEGDVYFQEEIFSAADICRKLAIEPISPSAKEGLSLINGTHFMGVLAAFVTAQAETLMRSADVISALSLDAVRGTAAAFDERIHSVRAQEGQRQVAQNIRLLYKTQDEIMQSHITCDKVQDPYSFRCIPQVHGASRDALEYVKKIVNIELNSVTDNPLCFDDGSIISGGNFHGQPLALAMDFLGIAVAEMGSISERRIEKLTNPHMSGLPAFLTNNSGLNSGFMIPHVVSAALVSENKVLVHPASTDSIPTSADKEDHVSMGPIAARKAQKIIENVARILAIELLAACQGLDLLSPLEPNLVLKKVHQALRAISPKMNGDRSLRNDIELISDWILADNVIKLVEEAGVALY